MFFIFIFAKWKHKLKCSTEPQLKFSCFCFSPENAFGTFFHHNFPNPGFFFLIYEFFSFPEEICLTETCQAFKVPLSYVVRLVDSPVIYPCLMASLQSRPHQLCETACKDHIIEGIRWEQKFLCFIYSIIVEGWKAVSQLCLGVDLK